MSNFECEDAKSRKNTQDETAQLIKMSFSAFIQSI
jgi:hypothetical protein